VEFTGLMVTPYVNDANRLAYSLKATGVRAPSRGFGRPAENKDAASVRFCPDGPAGVESFVRLTGRTYICRHTHGYCAPILAIDDAPARVSLTVATDPAYSTARKYSAEVQQRTLTIASLRDRRHT
jgi:hypothetical protein